MEWTQSGRNTLDQAMKEYQVRLAGIGVDPAGPVKIALERVDQVLQQMNPALVDEDAVRRALAEANLYLAGTTAPSPKRKWLQTIGRGVLLGFGIILPLIALSVEAFTGMCAETFFDPIPTIGHALLIAIVPLACAAAALCLHKKWLGQVRLLGLLNGIGVSVSLVYTIVFLPVLPSAAFFGLIGLLYFGMGLLALLPMSPLLSLAALLFYRNAIRRSLGRPGGVPGFWRGVLIGLLLVLLVSMPELATRVGMQMAASDNPGKSATGVRILRKIGNEDLMLRRCYQMGSWPGNSAWSSVFDSGVPCEKAREIWFRVTGESFDSTRAPTIRLGRGTWSGTDDFTFDPEQGGDVVAGRLKGLQLSESRMDGSVDADSAVAYLEWTFVFKNSYTMQREARAQIALPHGAVVSRVTLWINGEEREAAFGGRSQVREAYQKVVRQRRDPVLVTTCGPDRILLQCFPVPVNGEMKTRIGITIPAKLVGPGKGMVLLPRIDERNFSISEEVHHAVWIESRSGIASASSLLKTESATNATCTVRGYLTDKDLCASANGIVFGTASPLPAVWTPDSFDQGFGILQTVRKDAVQPCNPIVFVLDSSKDMVPYLAAVAEVIGRAGKDARVIVAGDKVEELGAVRDSAGFARLVAGITCEGGRDNVPALVRAWDLAAASPNGAIVWIHGPQRYMLSGPEQLRQLFERRPLGPVLYEYQTHSGPNRVIEKLDGLVPVRSIARLETVGPDIGAMLRETSGDGSAWVAAREKKSLTEIDSAVILKGSAHLSRLWAYDQVQADFRSGDKSRLKQAVATAVKYHLVTPVSGGVVLETTAQYAEAGLEPVDPSTVQVVPEPEVWALIIVGAAILFFVSRRRIQSRAA